MEATRRVAGEWMQSFSSARSATARLTKQMSCIGFKDHVTRLEQEETSLRTQLKEAQKLAETRDVREADRGDTHSLRGMLRLLKTSRRFEYLVCLLILLNALTIGAQAHWRMDNVLAPRPQVFFLVETTFTVVFALELLLRIVAEGLDFLSPTKNPKNFKQNLFDAAIVCSAVVEELLAHFSEEAPNVSVIRLLRVLRMVRVVRVIRVLRFFRDLRVMVAGIMSSGRSLVWAMVLLTLIMYVFAVLFMQVMAERLREGDLSLEEVDAVLWYYGSLWVTLYTLFMSICGGVDWQEAAAPLFHSGYLLVLCFVLYVSFGILCVLNIITGVFVENANAMTARDEDALIMEQLNSRRQYISSLRELFRGVGADADGILDWEQFEAHFGDLRVRNYFKKLGVDVDGETAEGIFELFDFDQDGFIDSDDLVLGLQHIHGGARALDLYRVDRRLDGVESSVRELACKALGSKEARTKSGQCLESLSSTDRQHE